MVLLGLALYSYSLYSCTHSSKTSSYLDVEVNGYYLLFNVLRSTGWPMICCGSGRFKRPSVVTNDLLVAFR